MNTQKKLQTIYKKINRILSKDLDPVLKKADFSNYKYSLSQPIYDSKEISAAVKSLINLNLSSGKNVLQFENNFKKYIGCKYAVAVNSGSSANLLALASIIEKYNLKKNDEVIIPAATFATVAMPIIQLGLKPVFVDIEEKTLNISIKEIKKAISSKTRIIMPVHTLGNPVNIQEIKKIIKNKKIIIFEDCCEAHGSRIRNKKVGSFGDISAFSFFVAHNMTTGEGGMILTNDKKLFEICLSLRAFGRINLKKNNLQNRFYSYKNLKDYDTRYVFERLGYNLRMTDIAAGMGIEQLKKLDNLNNIRVQNAKKITNLISKKYKKYFNTLKVEKNGFHSYYTFPFLLNKTTPFSRKEICIFLEKNGIETRPLFAGSLPDQPAFENTDFIKKNLQITNYIRDKAFFIGIHPGISSHKIRYIFKVFERFFLKYK